MKLTGAEILCQTLEHLGVKEIFGYPGGAILPVYDALGKSKLHHVLVRHEQGATHMADGYARASGGVGVAMATSGPGATNMVTGIATAMLDSSPIVCITGQVGSKLLGSDAFQEIDITGITMPITKHNVIVSKAEDIARSVREAFVIAESGRPGAGRHYQGCPTGCSRVQLGGRHAQASTQARSARREQGRPRSRGRASALRKAPANSCWPRHHDFGCNESVRAVCACRPLPCR